MKKSVNENVKLWLKRKQLKRLQKKKLVIKPLPANLPMQFRKHWKE